jgi:hypothetical protein
MHRIIPISVAFISILVVAGLVWPFIASDHRRASRDVVMEASQRNDPRGMALNPGFNSYVRQIHLPDGTECGIVTMKDRSEVCYWFASHHLTRDHGSTLFRFTDGSERIMAGCFCCEVQLPESGLADVKDLHAFINRHDGLTP